MAYLSVRDQGRGWSRAGSLGKKEARVMDNEFLLDWRGMGEGGRSLANEHLENYVSFGGGTEFWEPLQLLSLPL